MGVVQRGAIASPGPDDLHPGRLQVGWGTVSADEGAGSVAQPKFVAACRRPA